MRATQGPRSSTLRTLFCRRDLGDLAQPTQEARPRAPLRVDLHHSVQPCSLFEGQRLNEQALDAMLCQRLDKPGEPLERRQPRRNEVCLDGPCGVANSQTLGTAVQTANTWSLAWEPTKFDHVKHHILFVYAHSNVTGEVRLLNLEFDIVPN